MKLTKCPKCGNNSIFLIDTPELTVRVLSVIFTGTVDIGRIINIQSIKKIKASCNDGDCKQKLWYYPCKAIITRRNK